MNDPALREGVTRRGVLAGSLASGLAVCFGVPSVGARAAAAARRRLLGFAAVSPGAADRVTVPNGYRTQVLIPWGTPITDSTPGSSQAVSASDQAQQAGMHHDGMHFFPIDEADGLLVVNHEYIEPRFLHAEYIGRRLSREDVVVEGGERRVEQVQK